MSASLTTLAHLFCQRVAQSGDRPALFLPTGDGAKFSSLTWNEIAQEVRRLAAGLRKAGVEPGDRVALVSENRYEWVLVDLAVHLARGVHVAIHSTLSGPQIAGQIVDAEPRLAIVSNQEQADKLAGLQQKLPAILPVYAIDPVDGELAGQPVLPFTELLSGTGKDGGADIEKETLEKIRPDDLATILYTSGTTGESKGVMLTHANLASNAIGACEAFDTAVEDRRLCWLPLSHIFARTCDLYTWLVRGSQLGLAENREKIIAHCAEFHPTLMNGVPYFFDKVYRGLSAAGKVGPSEPGGQTPLQQLLGGEIRACCSGGAALADHVAEFFWKEGVPLVQGYGLTETSPVITTCTPRKHKVGTVGPALDGVEVRISDDGEILTRGPHVMAGYWRREADTSAMIREGWLYTGDLGELDGDGYLRITGRKKEILVTAGGKNVAPVYLEGLLLQEPLILQAMVVGDARKFLTALIVPNPDTLRAEIIARQIPVMSAAEALAHPTVHQLYRDRIDARLTDVSTEEQICKFKLLPRGFTIEQEELTPTLKLRRQVVAEHFRDEIESMYAE